MVTGGHVRRLLATLGTIEKTLKVSLPPPPIRRVKKGCTYIHICVCMHMCMYTHVGHACAWHTCVWVGVCAPVCVRAMCACEYMCVHGCTQASTRVACVSACVCDDFLQSVFWGNTRYSLAGLSV